MPQKASPRARLKPDYAGTRPGGIRLGLAAYLVKVARLGGYLARAKDPPPGHIVMWRGLCRLLDIQIGVQLGPATCG